MLLRLSVALICYFLAIVKGNSETSKDSLEKIDAFTRWFQKNQGILNGIEIYSFPEMGNGFRTTKVIQENDLVLKVPNHLILTIENMKDHSNVMIRWFHQYFHTASSEQAIIMWLLYEKYLGILSTFAEYIEILPKKVPSLIYFSDEELSLLQSPWFEQDTRTYQQQLQTNYRTFLSLLQTMLQEKSSDISPIVRQVFLPTTSSFSTIAENGGFTIDLLQQKFTYQDYLWAVSILNSRALRFYGEIHLIPMADIFNYEKHHQSRQQDNGNFFLQYHRFDPKTKSISIYSDRNVDHVGKQLFEDYGDNTNEIYFTYHGFIPHFVNPFHCVSFPFQYYWKYLLHQQHRTTSTSSSSSSFSHTAAGKEIEKILQDQKIDFRQTENQQLAEKLFKQLLSKEKIELFELLHFPLTSLSSICIKQDGKIPRQFLVVFSILAMTKRQLSKCKAVVEEQNLEAQGSNNNKKRINWLKIYEGCQFDEVYESFEKEISVAFNAVATGATIEARQAERENQQRKRRRELAKIKKSREENEEEEEEDEDLLEVDLPEQSWEVIKQFLNSTLLELRYPSSIDDDRQLLNKVGQLKRAAVEEEEREHWINVESAIKYRSTNKAYYLHICSLYELDCSAMYASTHSNEPILPKEDEEKKSTAGAIKTKTTTSLETTTDKTDGSPNNENASLLAKIDLFNQWFSTYDPFPNMIKAHLFNNHYRIGTVVTANSISKEEIYLGVPVDVVLSAEKAFHAPGIQTLVQQLYQKYGRNDEFHELVFFLLYETFIRGEHSVYYPYLTLLPTLDELRQNLPLFWEPTIVRQRLSPSHLLFEVLNYQRRIQRRYSFLQNITEITSFFKVPISMKGDRTDRVNYFTYDNYLWATAILDSRSIWWNGKRHLVPMLDFINCAENPSDLRRIHSTKLDESQQYAITLSGDVYEEGDQLFENYGQPNHIYYQYHGFILPDNSHDCLQYTFFLESSEYARLKKDGLTDYLETVYFFRSADDAFSTCLTVPIPPKVWIFLALKENAYQLRTTSDHVIDFKALSNPKPKTIQALANILKQHLSAYRKEPTAINHAISFDFLKGEQKLIKSIQKHLSKLKSRDEEEEEFFEDEEL